MTKKLISILVAAFMVLALLPMGVLAEGAAKNATRSAELPTKDEVPVDGSLLFENFDGDSLANPDWWLYNADGEEVTYNSQDYSNWGWWTFPSGYAHSGTDAMASYSYKTGSGWTQDNWLITPDLTIPTEGYFLSYYARSYSGYYLDHLQVLVGEYGEAYDYDSEGYSIDPDAWTSVKDLYEVPSAYEQALIDLSDFAGKTIAIAFRHADTNQWAVILDDVNVGLMGEIPEPTPEPDLGELVQGYYFEAGSNAENFTFVDKDGDGFNWVWQEDQSVIPYCDAFEGEGMIYSESYDNDTEAELTPDNWAISPAVTLPTGTAAVSLYAEGQDSDWCDEVFAIYAGTTADPDQMTKVGGDFTATGAYVKYFADLSAFVGQTVYIAIRHYNVTNMFMLDIDQVEVWGTNATAPVTHTVTFVDGLTNEVIATATVNDGEDATLPEAPVHAGYTFTGWEGDYTNVTEDVTVTAHYELNLYQLVIEYKYEDNTEAAPTRYDLFYAYGESYSIESPAITGYTPDIPVVEGVMGTSTLRVIVTYHPNMYTVTFVDWDDTVIDTQTVAYGGAAAAPADPAREGYTFTGWDAAFNYITGNLVVTAQYEQNEIPSDYLKGDVNCDGFVDTRDLALAAAIAMNAGSTSAQGVANGDMNGDGLLNSSDLSSLAAYIGG